jgi:hypothetical protein
MPSFRAFEPGEDSEQHPKRRRIAGKQQQLKQLRKVQNPRKKRRHQLPEAMPNVRAFGPSDSEQHLKQIQIAGKNYLIRPLQAMQISSSYSFWMLPAEVRNIIYKEALLAIWADVRYICYEKDGRRFQHKDWDLGLIDTLLGEVFDCGLYLANRQTHQEFGSYFWHYTLPENILSERPVHFLIFEPLKFFLQNLPDSKKHMLRIKLRFTGQDRIHMDMVEHTLQVLRRAKTLEVQRAYQMTGVWPAGYVPFAPTHWGIHGAAWNFELALNSGKVVNGRRTWYGKKYRRGTWQYWVEDLDGSMFFMDDLAEFKTPFFMRPSHLTFRSNY